MKYLKSRTLKKSISLHNILSITGGAALLIFALSGMLHPVMTWTGPKAAAFFPPRMSVTAQDTLKIPAIMERAGVESASIIKAIPSETGPVLQVTQTRDAPRRYFSLHDATEKPGYDSTHAQWLARYYTGLTDTPIKDIVFQTQFDDAYPWVNRLLPVYKITFDTDDNRTVFIYTELNALAGITNDMKTSFQALFRALHTWDWLNNNEHARVIIMGILLLSLFAMAATGAAMVFLMKNRKMETKRKLHRYIAYVVWLPLLMFSASGSYHLLQYAYGERHRGMHPPPPLSFTSEAFGDTAGAAAIFDGVSMNGLNLIEGPNDTLLYRMSIPQPRPGSASVTRAERFNGVPIEKPAIYVNAITGAESAVTDRAMAVHYAEQYGFKEEYLTAAARITHFGPHYDFRNKRLPVWQLDYDTPLGDKIFIDPATGVLVDRLTDTERYEGYSFSFLHKWSFLTPLTGRKTRDIVMVIVLSTAVCMTILGYIMFFKRRRVYKQR